MGTDIHVFVEMDWSEEKEAFVDREKIYAFNSGELSISRDYDLFNALADGRSCHSNEEDIDRHCLYSRRGIPKHHSVAVGNRYFHLVDDYKYTNIMPELYPKLSNIGNEQANKYLKNGLSFLGEESEIWHEGICQKTRQISHPHWHSCSWLTLIEIYRSLEHYDLDISELDFSFRIVLNIMTDLEKELGSGRTRLVFWFDN
ncbi:MAG: hypothetical protein AAFO95_11675 [Cyanobacteria bacterium J06600_6]